MNTYVPFSSNNHHMSGLFTLCIHQCSIVFNQANSKIPNFECKSLWSNHSGFSLLPKKLMHSKDQRFKLVGSFWNICMLLLYWYFITNAQHFLVIIVLYLTEFIKCTSIEENTFLLTPEIHLMSNFITTTATHGVCSLIWRHHSLLTQ